MSGLLSEGEDEFDLDKLDDGSILLALEQYAAEQKKLFCDKFEEQKRLFCEDIEKEAAKLYDAIKQLEELKKSITGNLQESEFCDVAEGGVMKRLGICCTKPDCKVVLKRDRAMKQHLVSVHHLTPYQCYALGCNRQFAKRTQLSAHMDAEHRDNRIWVCYDCYRAFFNVQLVRQHVFMHHQLGRFKCTSGQCSFVGKTRAQVYQHREKAHDSGELVKTNSD